MTFVQVSAKNEQPSESKQGEISGSYESSGTETDVKKHQLALNKRLSKEGAFELFYKNRVSFYKKLNPTFSLEELRECAHKNWKKMGPERQKEFCKRHLNDFNSDVSAILCVLN